jgi:hypothetical protein
MQTLIKSVNQYRAISTRFINFDCNAHDLEFVGYVKNQGVSLMKGITVHNFDTISYLATSEKGYYHCVGLNGKILTQIILKQSE